ncbi:MAG: MerC domain-containing protein [Pseudomonadota bacterium]
MRVLFDKMAVFLSVLCIVHCLAIPLLLVVFPTALTGAAHTDMTHYVLFIAAFPLSVFAMFYGYRTHKRARYSLVAFLGLAGLAAGLALHGLTYEVYATITGAVVLALAHLGNKAAAQTASAV